MALQERIKWFVGDAEAYFAREDLEFRMKMEEVEENGEQESVPIVIELPSITPISISDIVVNPGDEGYEEGDSGTADR